MRIDISLSTDFRAFSRTKESLARATWHLRTVRSVVFPFFFFVRYRALSSKGGETRFGVVLFFLFFFCSIPCVVFSKGGETRFGEGLLGLKKVTHTERQTYFLNINLLLSGLEVWAG